MPSTLEIVHLVEHKTFRALPDFVPRETPRRFNFHNILETKVPEDPKRSVSHGICLLGKEIYSAVEIVF